MLEKLCVLALFCSPECDPFPPVYAVEPGTTTVQTGSLFGPYKCT